MIMVSIVLAGIAALMIIENRKVSMARLQDARAKARELRDSRNGR
jgi:hypothetical protein